MFAAGAERRIGCLASILIGCAKTDGTITGNITGSFCIVLLANTVVLHDRLAIKNTEVTM